MTDYFERLDLQAVAILMAEGTSPPANYTPSRNLRHAFHFLEPLLQTHHPVIEYSPHGDGWVVTLNDGARVATERNKLLCVAITLARMRVSLGREDNAHMSLPGN